MKFIAIHYMDHYNAPIDILMWLYDMAEYRDYQKIYAKGPQTTAGKGKKGQKKEESEEEVDYGESTLTVKSHKDIKKGKKPAPPPSKP